MTASSSPRAVAGFWQVLHKRVLGTEAVVHVIDLLEREHR
jgi:hypothetical protein